MGDGTGMAAGPGTSALTLFITYGVLLHTWLGKD